MAKNESSTDTRISEDLKISVLDPSINAQTASYMNGTLLRYILFNFFQTEQSNNDLFNKLESFTSLGSGYAQHISEKVKREYKSDEAICWYTEESFLYEALNKALREQDVDFLYGIRQFLVDLYEQLQKNHLNFDVNKPLYRGVKLIDYKAEELENNLGKLIHFDQFLSTSTDQEVAKTFMKNLKPGDKPILFHIDISSAARYVSPKEEPIACIQEFSHRPYEKEVLLPPSSVFRLKDIRTLLDNDTKIKVCHVFLELTTARDHDLQATYQQLKKDIYIYDNFPTSQIQLAKLLRRLDKPDMSIKYYHLALDELNNAHKISTYTGITNYELNQTTIYTDLALTYRQKRDYDNAYIYLDRAGDCAKKLGVQSNARPFLAIMNAKLLIYTDKNELSNALKCNKEILEMEKAAGIQNTREHATTLNNLGVLYIRCKQIDQALIYFREALDIQKRILPNNHLDIAKTYNNMSVYYFNVHDFTNAKEYLEKAKAIKDKILPENHESTANTLAIAGAAQFVLSQYDDAYNTLEQAADIYTRKGISRTGTIVSQVKSIQDLAYEEIKKTS